MINKIKEILIDTRPEYDFEGEVNFIENGMLDSFDVITLVSEFEEAFDITIYGEDIIPDNFSNIEAMKRLITKSNKTN